MIAVCFIPRAAIGSCYTFDIREDFKNARAVFVGTVASTKPMRTDDRGVDTVAGFVVERQWKGPLRKTLDVMTCGTIDGPACLVGVLFQPGERYLVFAYRDRLETTNCTAWRLDKSADAGERRQGERHLKELERGYRQR
jgi:hypothetical protein